MNHNEWFHYISNGLEHTMLYKKEIARIQNYVKEQLVQNKSIFYKN